MSPATSSTEPGVVYRVVRGSDGAPVAADDTVTIHYRLAVLGDDVATADPPPLPHEFAPAALLEDTWLTGSPVTFTVGRAEVLKGIDEGVVGMRIAEERVFKLSPGLAYGARGHGDTVPPLSWIWVHVYVVARSSSHDM